MISSDPEVVLAELFTEFYPRFQTAAWSHTNALSRKAARQKGK